MTEQFRTVYVTCASREEARQLGRSVVEQRLAACANILGEIESFYWWQGRLEKDAEVALLFKTRAALVPRLVELVRRLHSYDVPCVVSWPIAEGNPDYLAWLRDETAGADAGDQEADAKD